MCVSVCEPVYVHVNTCITLYATRLIVCRSLSLTVFFVFVLGEWRSSFFKAKHVDY